jgi:hypothetical protein
VHHGLGCRELLPLGAPGHRSLDGSAKYGTAVTPSWSLAAGGGDEEDAGAGSGDEGRGGQQARLQRQYRSNSSKALLEPYPTFEGYVVKIKL